MKDFLKFNLQMFAADPGGGGGGAPADPIVPPADPAGETPPGGAAPEVPKAYTPTEIAALQEAAKAEAIKEAEIAAAAAKAKEEELGKLSATQRAQKEADDAKAALAQLQAERDAEKATADAAKELATRQLPVEFAELVVKPTNAETLVAIVAVEATFKAAVEAAVNARLATGAGAPPALNPVTGKPDDWAAADAAMLAKYQ